MLVRTVILPSQLPRHDASTSLGGDARMTDFRHGAGVSLLDLPLHLPAHCTTPLCPDWLPAQPALRQHLAPAVPRRRLATGEIL